MNRWIILFSLSLCGCTATIPGVRNDSTLLLEEIRTEVGDLRHCLNGLETECRLLEERGDSKEKGKIALLEGEIASLKAQIQSLKGELQSYATQTTASFATYRDRMIAIDQQLATISSRSHTTKVYRVQGGDTLEKIARKHSVSVELLKQTNSLSSDLITIGQELKIPS